MSRTILLPMLSGRCFRKIDGTSSGTGCGSILASSTEPVRQTACGMCRMLNDGEHVLGRAKEAT